MCANCSYTPSPPTFPSKLQCLPNSLFPHFLKALSHFLNNLALSLLNFSTKKMYFLLLLIQSSVSQTCPKYTCKKSSMSFTPETCLFYNSTETTYYAHKCSDPLLPYCQVVSLANSSCVAAPASPLRFPGEKCTVSSNCTALSTCTGGVCVANGLLGPCTGDLDCNPGLYCGSGSVCVALIEPMESGCFNDNQCVNNAACNLTSAVTGGTCVGYFNISDYDYVATCTNNRNLLCSTGYCLAYLGANVCFGDAVNAKVYPFYCEGTCRSNTDINLGDNYIPGQCTCGYNPGRFTYCNEFYQDSQVNTYFSLLTNWLTGTDITKCHTLARNGVECAKEHFGDFVEYVYRMYKFSNYQSQVDAESCVLQVVLPDYYNAKEVYNRGAMIAAGLAVISLS